MPDETNDTRGSTSSAADGAGGNAARSESIPAGNISDGEKDKKKDLGGEPKKEKGEPAAKKEADGLGDTGPTRARLEQFTRSKQPSDPTEEIAPTSRELLSFGNARILEWSRRLAEERILLVNSIDEEVVDSVSRHIRNETRFQALPWRALYFKPLSGGAEFWDILAPAQAYESETIVVVYAVSRGSERFLQNLPNELHLLDWIRGRLTNQQKRLLILTTDQSLKSAGRIQLKQDRFSINIEFLVPILLRDLPSSSQSMLDFYQACELSLNGEDRLAEFRKRVHAAFNDEHFSTEYRGLAREPERKSQIEALLRRVLEACQPGARVQAAPIDGLLDEEQPLRNTVLFVAAFFENLSVEDFQKTVTSLVEGRTITVVTTPAAPTGVDNTVPASTVEVKTLTQIWSERRQRLINECSLRVGHDGSVDFNDGSGQPMRSEMQRAFGSLFPFMHDDLFHRVAASGLLFSSSETVSEGARKLVADRATRDASYGRNCIIESIVEAAPVLQADTHILGQAHALTSLFGARSMQGSESVTVFSTEMPPADQAKGISWLLAGMPRERRDQAFRQLRALLATFLERGLNQPAEAAIIRLMEVGLHPEALTIVKRLWNHRQFAALQVGLMKRIFDQADKKTRCDAYNFVCGSISQGEGDVATLLSCFFDWLPKDGEPAASPSARLILKLVVDLSEDALTNERNRAVSPIATALSAGTVDDFASRAGKWLFHPGLEPILNYRANEAWVSETRLEDCDPAPPGDSHPYIQEDYIFRLMFGWIMPRGYMAPPDADFYFLVFFEALRRYKSYLPPASRQSIGVAFRALVIADVVMMLAPTNPEPNPIARERLLGFMREIARQADVAQRRHLSAQWHALAETMLEARAVANTPNSPFESKESNVFRKRFAARLGALRQVVRQTRKLFTEACPRRRDKDNHVGK